MKPEKPYRAKEPPYTWWSAALFWDLRHKHTTTPIDPIFSLYQKRPGLICCRDTFIELNDPTGYKWAMEYLGSWEHWNILMKSTWFVEAYNVWIAELEMKIRSEAIIRLQEIANGDSSQAISAAKYLATLDYKKASVRGRPSKEELKGEMARLVKLTSEEQDDYERIRVVK